MQSDGVSLLRTLEILMASFTLPLLSWLHEPMFGCLGGIMTFWGRELGSMLCLLDLLGSNLQVGEYYKKERHLKYNYTSVHIRCTLYTLTRMHGKDGCYYVWADCNTKLSFNLQSYITEGTVQCRHTVIMEPCHTYVPTYVLTCALLTRNWLKNQTQ